MILGCEAVTAEKALRLIAVRVGPITFNMIHGVVPASHNRLGSKLECHEKQAVWGTRTYTSRYLLTSYDCTPFGYHAWEADWNWGISPQTLINAGLQEWQFLDRLERNVPVTCEGGTHFCCQSGPGIWILQQKMRDSGKGGGRGLGPSDHKNSSIGMYATDVKILKICQSKPASQIGYLNDCRTQSSFSKRASIKSSRGAPSSIRLWSFSMIRAQCSLRARSLCFNSGRAIRCTPAYLMTWRYARAFK